MNDQPTAETVTSGSDDTSAEAPWEQAELVRLMDVAPAGAGRYVAPSHGASARNVVEAGQLLGDAVVAASKEVPHQRVVSASMIFSRAAKHDTPIEVGLEVLRSGRTLSTVQARITQQDSLSAAGIVLLDAGAPDLVRSAAPMPQVDPPHRLRSVEHPAMVVHGRDIRVVDDAYDWDPDRVGPPELFVWTRFQQSPAREELHAALLTQSTTHWTVAAALRPHRGFSDAMAHASFSSGITKATVTYHEDVDVTQWLLYATSVTYSGRGLAQSEGLVYQEDGALVASYSVQAMLRAFPERDSGTTGKSTDTVL